ncbi:MAG: hypothetical protein ACR5LD_10865 [Symbiopectobacterium sp.]
MTFTPQNKLEEVLMNAATEPAHWPEFFTELMDVTVYQGASTLPVVQCWQSG